MAAAVPFALKAIPFAAQGIGALLGKKASGPSKGQQAAVAGTQQGAQTLSAAGQPLLTSGLNYASQAGTSLAPAAQYYSSILSNRRAASESLAPEQQTALEYYRGAEGKTRRTMRGGARDQALAELDRQRVGQLAGMLPAARRSAAEGLQGVAGTYGSLGTSLTGQGTNALTNAAYIQSGLFDQATKIREQEAAGGKAWGGFLYDMASQVPWGKLGKKPLPSSRNPVTNLPSLPPVVSSGGGASTDVRDYYYPRY